MSLLQYHKLTTEELLALTHKVRNLINHWGEDGRYKEAVLKNVLRRFLPERFLIGSGFVIKPTEIRGEHVSSRQIDLIIYDNSGAVLFREGDFVILTPDCVRGVIEVKNNLQNQNITEVVKQANRNGQFIFTGKSTEEKKLAFFNGIFAYEGYGTTLDYEAFSGRFNAGNIDFRDHESYAEFKVNHVSLNKDRFIKYWCEDQSPHSLYRINDLSFPFFISNLIKYLSNEPMLKNNFIWFVTDKELQLEHQF